MYILQSHNYDNKTNVRLNGDRRVLYT